MLLRMLTEFNSRASKTLLIQARGKVPVVLGMTLLPETMKGYRNALRGDSQRYANRT
jgi:hypothetical protein